MNGKKSKSSLFLIEMLIAIFFFALAAIVGTRLFALSQVTANSSTELNFAVSECSSIAEVFESCKGDISAMSVILGGSLDEKYITLFYDENWQEKEDVAEASYRIKVNVISENNLANVDIVVCKLGEGKNIYKLSESRYFPQKISEKGVVAK